MSLIVVFRREAEADLLEQHDWYEEQQTGWGDAFSDKLEDAINRIRSMPRMYAKVLRDFRRAKMHKFPYLIYYRVKQDRTRSNRRATRKSRSKALARTS